MRGWVVILCRHRWCFRPATHYRVWCSKHMELITLGYQPAPWDERRLVLPPPKPRAPACSSLEVRSRD